MNDYSWIQATILGVTGIVSAIAAVVVMHSNYEKRKIAVAKENSAGAYALEMIRKDIQKNTEQINNLEKQMEEAREDIRENGREYLRTLKELASKFRN